MYKVCITETSRNSMKDKSIAFNQFAERFKTFKEAKNYVIERYKDVKTKHPIFIDVGKDKTAKQIGYTFGFWNSDISHNSEKWFQEDWVEIKQESFKYKKW